MCSKRTRSKWKVHRAPAAGGMVSSHVTLRSQIPIPGFHVVRLNGGTYAVHILKNYPIFTCSAPSHMRLILSFKQKATKKGQERLKVKLVQKHTY